MPTRLTDNESMVAMSASPAHVTEVWRSRPSTIAVEDAEAKQHVKDQFLKKRQGELDSLLREEDIDWRQVRNLMVRTAKLNPNYTDPSTQMSTAHRAAYAGEAEILSWCLRGGADVNARSAIRRSLLHYACDANRIACVRLLLEHGADVNILTLSHRTPLHTCCANNCYESVLELLHGTSAIVDIDAEDSQRQLPQDLTQNKFILRLIRKYRATMEERRKVDLVEQALQRLVQMFAKQERSCITAAEFAEYVSELKQDQSASKENLQAAVRTAATNADGTVSIEEFRKVQMALLQAQTVDYRELLRILNDLETSIFVEAVRDEPGEWTPTATTTPRTLDAAERRRLRGLAIAPKALGLTGEEIVQQHRAKTPLVERESPPARLPTLLLGGGSGPRVGSGGHPCHENRPRSRPSCVSSTPPLRSGSRPCSAGRGSLLNAGLGVLATPACGRTLPCFAALAC